MLLSKLSGSKQTITLGDTPSPAKLPSKSTIDDDLVDCFEDPNEAPG